MKWLAVVLVLLGLAGNQPAGYGPSCPQSQTACAMGCCAGAELSCCAQSGQPQNAPQAPANARDLQILMSPAPSRSVLILPIAHVRAPARSISLSVVLPPADRLAALCSFLI